MPLPANLEIYEEYIAATIATRIIQDHASGLKRKNNFHMTFDCRLESGVGGPTLDTNLKALDKKGVITFWEVYNYNYRKTERTRHVDVSPEWYEKYVSDPQNSDKPVFELKELKIQEKPYLNDEYEAADKKSLSKTIYQLHSRQQIYVASHPEEYEYTIESADYRGDCVTLFPKEFLDKRDDLIWRGNVKEFLVKNFSWVTENMLEISSILNFDDDTYKINTRPLNFGELKKWSEESVTKKIANAKKNLEYLTKVIPFLEELKEKVKGTVPEDLLEKLTEDFIKYIKENYPLHLNDENKDLKKLAEWMVLGKNVNEKAA